MHSSITDGIRTGGRRRRLLAGAAIAMMTAGVALAIGAPSASAADGPTVSVTPAAGLDPAGATVTVSGTGFAAAEPGFYVGVAGTAHYSATNLGAFAVAKWVHLGATPSAGQDVLNSDGTFSTALTFPATFGSGANATDCRSEQCAIFTFAAHGSADRSQDTSTPITFFAPSITLTPSTGLANGDAVVVTGKGFVPGKGIYVAETVAKPAGGPPSNYTGAKWIQSVGVDGTFATTVTAADTFTAPGAAGATDCRVVSCFVATFNDHTDITNRNQDVWAPITFAAAEEPTPTPTPTPTEPTATPTPTEPTEPTATPTPTEPTATPTPTAPAGPAISVDPVNGLDPAGQTLTITGSGFAATGPGIYVGIASTAKFSPTSMDAFGPAKWVHLGATPSAGQDVLGADGTFSITLDVTASFGAGSSATDCRTEQCAVFTFAAHGSSDRSQDTHADVSFTGASITPTSTPTETSPATTDRASAEAADRSVALGGRQTVSGAGFTPGELVQATLHSDPVDLGTLTAADDGSVRVSFTIPATLSTGAHTVTLVGLSSGQSATAAFTVVAAGTSPHPSATSALPLTAGTSTGASLASTGAAQVGALTMSGIALAGAGALLLLFTGAARRRGRHV
jgi:hypothetical protein